MVSPAVVRIPSTPIVGEGSQSRAHKVQHAIRYTPICSQKVTSCSLILPHVRIIDILTVHHWSTKNGWPAGQMGLYSWQSGADADVVLTDKTKWWST